MTRPPRRWTDFAGAHLLTEITAGRYALHDLLRLYAADRSRQEDDAADRSAATRRLLAWYLHSADAAAARLYPSMLRLPRALPAPGPAPARFADHIRRARVARRRTADPGHRGPARRRARSVRDRPGARRRAARLLLAARPRRRLGPGGPGRGWPPPGADSARSARRGDGGAQYLGDRDLLLSRHPAAVGHYARALEFAERTGWLHGQAAILGNLGSAYWKAGRLPEAAAASTAAW